MHTLRAPDIAYFTADQVARIGDERGFPKVAPALAVEVRDASEPDIRRKVEQYLAAGVQAVWVVDLEAKSLTRYAPDQEPRTWSGPQAVVEEPVLPGFTFRLGDLLGEE